MTGAVLTAVFVIACLIWGGTWLIQIGAALIVLLFRSVVIAVTFLWQVVVMLVGSAGWSIWWLFNRKAAMASLKKAQDRG